MNQWSILIRIEADRSSNHFFRGGIFSFHQNNQLILRNSCQLQKKNIHETCAAEK